MTGTNTIRHKNSQGFFTAYSPHFSCFVQVVCLLFFAGLTLSLLALFWIIPLTELGLINGMDFINGAAFFSWTTAEATLGIWILILLFSILLCRLICDPEHGLVSRVRIWMTFTIMNTVLIVLYLGIALHMYTFLKIALTYPLQEIIYKLSGLVVVYTLTMTMTTYLGIFFFRELADILVDFLRPVDKESDL